MEGGCEHRKTKVIHFRKTGTPQSLRTFVVGELAIETVSRYKYLGTISNCYGNEDSIIEQLSMSGSRALGKLISKTKCNFELGYQSFTRLYNACVVPVLDCACGAWCLGRTNCEKLDRVQHRAIRYFCGLPKSTSILALTGDMGWMRGVMRRDLESLCLFNQIMKMPEERLTRKIFEYDWQCGNNTWSENVKSLLISIGAEECWVNNEAVNLKHAWERLCEMYQSVWSEDCVKKPKLCTYVKIKDVFETASHISANLSKAKRSVVSQLLCGWLPIQLELGRYQGLQRHERICNLCKIEPETETHFLFRCIGNADTRVKHYHKFPEILYIEDDIDKLRFLSKRPFQLGNFAYELWHERCIKSQFK